MKKPQERLDDKLVELLIERNEARERVKHLEAEAVTLRATITKLSDPFE